MPSGPAVQTAPKLNLLFVNTLPYMSPHVVMPVCVIQSLNTTTIIDSISASGN